MQTAIVALPESATDRTRTVPSIAMDCRVLVFAATCVYIGITWDISWHQTIGRDTFWTPAHMLLYVGAALAGLSGGYRVLQLTFQAKAEARAASVRIWGFYGPIGIWVAIWGALAMLISAPFDNWWHDAYGLDVKILSPPHAVLAAGMHHVVVGALVMAVSLQNRSYERGRKTGQWLFLYSGGVMLALAALLPTELSLPNQQRSATFYQVSAALYPVLLVSVARASRVQWPATLTALLYMGLRLAMTWILPLFPGTPKLAPIYNPIDTMVPPSFPLLLIVPAVAIDLLFRWLGRGRRWTRDLALVWLVSVVFLGLLLATQWFFAKFLLSPAADNWFFAGNRYWSYNTPPGDWHSKFWGLKSDPINGTALAWAWLWSFLSTLVGLGWGQWMSKVKR